MGCVGGGGRCGGVYKCLLKVFNQGLTTVIVCAILLVISVVGYCVACLYVVVSERCAMHCVM